MSNNIGHARALRRNWAVGLVVIAALAALPFSASGASFDCSKAKSRSEVLICTDPELSRLDDELGSLYRKAKAAAVDKAAFKQSNKIEWQRRERSCSDRDCLLAWYARRKEQLAATVRGEGAPESAIPQASSAADETIRPPSTPQGKGAVEASTICSQQAAFALMVMDKRADGWSDIDTMHWLGQRFNELHQKLPLPSLHLMQATVLFVFATPYTVHMVERDRRLCLSRLREGTLPKDMFYSPSP